MFPAFKVVRQLHEMLWYLADPTSRTFDPDTSHQVNELRMMTIEDVMRLRAVAGGALRKPFELAFAAGRNRQWKPLFLKT